MAQFWSLTNNKHSIQFTQTRRDCGPSMSGSGRAAHPFTYTADTRDGRSSSDGSSRPLTVSLGDWSPDGGRPYVGADLVLLPGDCGGVSMMVVVDYARVDS